MTFDADTTTYVPNPQVSVSEKVSCRVCSFVSFGSDCFINLTTNNLNGIFQALLHVAHRKRFVCNVDVYLAFHTEHNKR